MTDKELWELMQSQFPEAAKFMRDWQMETGEKAGRPIIPAPTYKEVGSGVHGSIVCVEGK